MQIIALGEMLWDVFPTEEFLGGAPLNFSAAAQRLGNDVAFITAVGDDERGRAALASMTALRLRTDFVHVVSGAATATAVLTIDKTGSASYVFNRPAVFDPLIVNETQAAQLAALQPQWIYFGSLTQTDSGNEKLVQKLVQSLPGVRCFYDINLREGHWNLALVERLSAMASILKLNDDEVRLLFGMTCAGEEFSLEGFCRLWSSRYAVDAICITLGGQGCAIFHEGKLQRFKGYAVKVVDTVGAGDAFAAAFLHGFAQSWPMERIASFANALGALVASRAGATPPWTVEECLQLMAGGTQS